MDACLKKDPKIRASTEELLQHSFMKKYDKKAQKAEYLSFIAEAYRDSQEKVARNKPRP